MFGTKHNECVGFESRWKVTKVYSETTTQTNQFTTKDVECNTIARVNCEIQTDEKEKHEVKDEDEMERLAKWLNKIYPTMRSAMNSVRTCRAFDNYRLIGDTAEAKSKFLQNLNVGKNLEGSSNNHCVSGLSWNCTGKTLAISCSYRHTTWCHHSGTVLIYVLENSQEDKLADVPLKQLSTSNCVTTIKFHPTNAAVIAAGTISGEIIIWNIHREDDDSVIAKLNNSHGNSITCLLWFTNLDVNKTVQLGSCSSDGTMKLWRFNSVSGKVSLKVTYKFKAPLFAKSNDSLVVRGVNCFDFSQFTPEMFVVGIEGGFVLQCSVLGTTELKGSTEVEPILDPTVKYYQPIDGEVTATKFSTSRREIFLTTSTDTQIRVYVIGQEEPAQIVFTRTPLNCLVWVPYEEKLVVGCGGEGVLEIYHLIKASLIENVTDEKVEKKCLMEVAINGASVTLTAIGTSDGFVQLWHVPWRLFSHSNK